MPERMSTKQLGEYLGTWVTGLDHTDQVVWAVLRFEDVLLGDRVPDVQLRLKLLRRQLAPRITVSQVIAVDALLDDGAWRDPDADMGAFRESYQGARTWRRRDPIPGVWLNPTVARNALDLRGGLRAALDPATDGPNRG